MCAGHRQASRCSAELSSPERWSEKCAGRPSSFRRVATAERCPGGAPQRRAPQVCAADRGYEPNAVDRSPVQASYTWDHQRAPCSVWGVPMEEPWVQAAVLTPSELWSGKGCSCNPSSPLCPSEGEGETTASSKCNSESEGQGGATHGRGGDGGKEGTQGAPRLGPGLCCAACT